MPLLYVGIKGLAITSMVHYCFILYHLSFNIELKCINHICSDFSICAMLIILIPQYRIDFGAKNADLSFLSGCGSYVLRYRNRVMIVISRIGFTVVGDSLL
jgi:hypothetical protein